MNSAVVDKSATAIALDQPLTHDSRRVFGRVNLKRINKSYHVSGRALPVIRDVSLDIAAGSFVSIVGPSGCGKSTLLRLIAGLDGDFSGELHLDDSPIRCPSLDRGLVFQDHRLFPWMTVEQNVAAALESRSLERSHAQRSVKFYLKLVALEGFEHVYPHQLSGGMAQRAAIARALVNEPKVLLLDEPLGSLDALTRLKLQTELQRIWQHQRNTVIMVTHDIDEALYLSDRVVVMDRGGQIGRVVELSAAHPRDRTNDAFDQLRAALLADLMKPTAP